MLNVQCSTLSKVLGAMEIGCGCAYRIPTDEVGNGQVISALIDITSEREAVQAGDVVAEEYGVGDAQCQLPCGGLFLGVEGSTPQCGPAVYQLGNLGGCQHTIVTTFAYSNQKRAGTVAFYVVIDGAIPAMAQVAVMQRAMAGASDWLRPVPPLLDA